MPGPRTRLRCRRCDGGRASHDRPAWRVAALLAIVLGLLVLGDLPVVHDHHASGVYNEECLLARLASGGARASLSGTAETPRPARAPEIVLAAPPTVLGRIVAAPFDSRGPPSSLPFPTRTAIR